MPSIHCIAFSSASAEACDLARTPHPCAIRSDDHSFYCACLIASFPARISSHVSHAALLRADASIEDVCRLLGPRALEAVNAARAHRKRLADIRVLTELKAVMPAADAATLGIKVLRQDAAGNLAVGMFDVPALAAAIAQPPKSA